MKPRLGLSILASVVIVATIAVERVSSQRTESVIQALTEYDRAWNSKDNTTVSRMLAKDYVYFSSTGGHTDRDATLKFLASPDYKLTYVNRSEIKVLSQRDRVAIVSSRWVGRGTYGKEEIDDDQRCGLVFVKEAGRWKLLSEHCVQIVTK